MLAAVAGRRTRLRVADAIESLRQKPEQAGWPLSGELSGYRTLHTPDRRFRLLYRIEKGRVIVTLVARDTGGAGDRRDIYVLARKLVKLRLFR